MEKVRYELDPYNRLVIDDSGRKASLLKFRRVLDGRFRIGKDNELTYHVKSPVSKGETIPHQIRLKGTWSLTDNHDLRLALDKEGRETLGDEITLKGEVLDVTGDSLLFAVTSRSEGNKESTYILNLSGVWQADKNNRLSFRVRKEKGRYDILNLSGAWQVNKNHEIIYQYEKADLIRKKRRTHTLTFKGWWEIRDGLRISYLMSGDTDSAFDFKTSAGLFKEGYIRYEAGIGLAGRARPVTRVITLYGRWNLKKGSGLTFEVEYEGPRVRAMVFGAEARLTDRDTISFRIRDEAGKKDIAANLELSRSILKGDGEAFLRALGSKREAAIYAGAAWRW